MHAGRRHLGAGGTMIAGPAFAPSGAGTGAPRTAGPHLVWVPGSVPS